MDFFQLSHVRSSFGVLLEQIDRSSEKRHFFDGRGEHAVCRVGKSVGLKRVRSYPIGGDWRIFTSTSPLKR